MDVCCYHFVSPEDRSPLAPAVHPIHIVKELKGRYSLHRIFSKEREPARTASEWYMVPSPRATRGTFFRI